MARRLKLEPHLDIDELELRYRQAQDGITRSHWQILWRLARGQRSEAVAERTGYSQHWLGKVGGRYHAEGEAGVGDRRHHNPGRHLSLTDQQQAELAQALEEKAPDGEAWTGPKGAAWMGAQLGRPVYPQRGWDMMNRLGYSSQTPRRRHQKADPESQQAFKKTLAP